MKNRDTWTAFLAAAVILISMQGCVKGNIKTGEGAHSYKGRIYFQNSGTKIKTEYKAVLEGDSFSMVLYSRFGETLGYVTGDGENVEIRDGDGRSFDGEPYREILNILLDVLKNERFDDKIDESGIILEFIQRDDNGFPYIWRIRDRLSEVKVIINEYDGERIR